MPGRPGSYDLSGIIRISLKAFFSPKSIAVYGASPSPFNLAGFILGNFQEMGFKRKGEKNGRRKI